MARRLVQVPMDETKAMDEEGSHISGPALLVDLRSHAGLSQAQLAERAAASRSMIAQVETGERRPSRKLLTRISRALELEAEEEDGLILAFGFTTARSTPDQIAAFLRADKHLRPDQAVRLADIVRRAYDRELKQQGIDDHE